MWLKRELEDGAALNFTKKSVERKTQENDEESDNDEDKLVIKE